MPYVVFCIAKSPWASGVPNRSKRRCRPHWKSTSRRRPGHSSSSLRNPKRHAVLPWRQNIYLGMLPHNPAYDQTCTMRRCRCIPFNRNLDGPEALRDELLDLQEPVAHNSIVDLSRNDRNGAPKLVLVLLNQPEGWDERLESLKARTFPLRSLRWGTGKGRSCDNTGAHKTYWPHPHGNPKMLRAPPQ